MRTARLLAAALTVVGGGFLLLIANGIFIAMQERLQGWHLTPIPSHPEARIVLYVTAALALQFVSAWFTMPAAIRNSPKTWRRLWARYMARVVFLVGGSVIVAFVLAFLLMALLDAGVL